MRILTVSEDDGPVPINISAPNGTIPPKLSVTVTSAPSDGSVLLSDGVTPVYAGETLTGAQLSSLQFEPTAGLFGVSSTFGYTVTGPLGMTATGIVGLAVGPDTMPPVTTSASLTAAENAGATTIGIAAPTDPNYAASQLSVTVTGLPTDGAVLLPDGTTAVSVGETLTAEQLTGLTFQPTTNASSANSSFTYNVTDPSNLSATGAATLAIGPPVSTTGVFARPATSFLGSLGVNTHLGYVTAYQNEGLVQASLAYLGINQIRDEMNSASYAQTEYNQLAAAGIKFDFGVNDGTSPSTFQGQLDSFAGTNPGALAAVEGPNETDFYPFSYGGESGVPAAVSFQEALYPAIKADPVLAGVPVYNFTVLYGYTAAGDMAPYADDANVHAYVWDGTSPNGPLLDSQANSQIDAPGLPTVFTEAGYDTDTSDPMSGVDPTVQAKYTLDTVMDAFNNGVASTYLYELLDEGTNPADPAQNYGLFYNDGTPKPAATAIHNLTQILADPGDPNFQPGSLDYTLSGLPADGASMLLQKSSGEFDLVLWAEPLLWNSNTQTELVAPTEQVGVNFGQSFGSVNVFDPLQGSAPIASSGNTQSIQIALTDHPIVVALGT